LSLLERELGLLHLSLPNLIARWHLVLHELCVALSEGLSHSRAASNKLAAAVHDQVSSH
jgi:hypothetical protein